MMNKLLGVRTMMKFEKLKLNIIFCLGIVVLFTSHVHASDNLGQATVAIGEGTIENRVLTHLNMI